MRKYCFLVITAALLSVPLQAGAPKDAHATLDAAAGQVALVSEDLESAPSARSGSPTRAQVGRGGRRHACGGAYER